MERFGRVDFQNPYFVYRENLLNQYVNCKVKITARGGKKKKNKDFIGIFKAFDKDLNVVLSDVTRMMTRPLRFQAIPGLMIIRGCNVRYITFEDSRQPSMSEQPEKWFRSDKKYDVPDREQSLIPEIPAIKNEPAPKSTKPIKIKRTWLTNAEPTPSTSSGEPTPSTSSGEPKPSTSSGEPSSASQ